MDNPKMVRAQKDGKTRFETLPLKALTAMARVMATGAEKYGRFNFLIDAIRASTYIGAIFRHFTAWATGETHDPESGEHHLAHVMACCGIVIEAGEYGMLIDDRMECESKSPDGGGRIENLLDDPFDSLPPSAQTFFDDMREYRILSDRAVGVALGEQIIGDVDLDRLRELRDNVSNILRTMSDG